MATVYIVVQMGVYRHDIRGVYSTAGRAESAAKRAAREDSDSYHEYEVWETVLDDYVCDAERTPGILAVTKETVEDE